MSDDFFFDRFFARFRRQAIAFFADRFTGLNRPPRMEFLLAALKSALWKRRDKSDSDEDSSRKIAYESAQRTADLFLLRLSIDGNQQAFHRLYDARRVRQVAAYRLGAFAERQLPGGKPYDVAGEIQRLVRPRLWRLRKELSSDLEVFIQKLEHAADHAATAHLFHLHKKGIPGAFDRLHQGFNHVAVSHARKTLDKFGVPNSWDAAKDVAQFVWVKFERYYDPDRERASLVGFLITTAHTEAIDYIKKNWPGLLPARPQAATVQAVPAPTQAVFTVDTAEGLKAGDLIAVSPNPGGSPSDLATEVIKEIHGLEITLKQPIPAESLIVKPGSKVTKVPVKVHAPPISASEDLSIEVHEELLGETLRSGGPPSEVLTCLNTSLGHKPKLQMERFFPLTLGIIERQVRGEWKARSPLSPERVEELFQPLRDALKEEDGGVRLADQELGSFWKGDDRELSYWNHNVKRRVRKACFQQEPDYYRLTFSGHEPPHSLVEFGYTIVLEMDAQTFWRSFADAPLRRLEYALEWICAAKAVTEPQLVHDAFQELRQRMDMPLGLAAAAGAGGDSVLVPLDPALLNRAAGDISMREFYGGAAHERVLQQRKQIEGRVRDQLLATRQGLLYAYMMKLIR